MSRQLRLPRPFGQALALQRPPLCREIALWLISEEVDLEAGCRELHEGESPPYWAFCWGSGQALARWLLDHPEAARDRRVVDLGSGSGVAGIAAAMCRARQVVAVDVDASAREATRANARANDLDDSQLRIADSLPPDWDLLLAGDLLYEGRMAGLLDALRRQADANGAVLLAAEPERPGNPGHRGRQLARYAVRTFPDVDSPTRAARVFRLSGAGVPDAVSG